MSQEEYPASQPGCTGAGETRPENGIKGLKHWRQDLVAGLIVSLVSVPLSLGIAIASGAPPVCGLISSIIAGLIFPFLGGAYMTISGPAAGLAPVVLGSICLLGHGNLDVGYRLVLGIICLAGILQLILVAFRAARFSAMLPASAIAGMLASIGLMIIAKQIPNFIGHPYHAHDFFPMLVETPHEIMLMDHKVIIISVVSLIILFSWSKIKSTRIKMIPPQLVAVFAGIIMGQLMHLDARFLIKIPANVLTHGLVFPDFNGLFSDHGMWLSIFGCVLTLTMVDGFESLATIMAIDKIDPFHRKSQPNRTLFAMGISNICSSLFGGLTIIPGGIKSTTCIMSGGRTLWANFYNAIFLICYLFIARDLINMIPLGTLAAVLMHIGFKLCAPAKWVSIAKIGTEQLVVFVSTIVMTLATDLLWGLLFGAALKFLMLAFMSKSFLGLFKNPVHSTELKGDIYTIRLGGPVVSFNALSLKKTLESVPLEAKLVHFEFLSSVRVVDHTSAANLMTFAGDYKRANRGTVEIGAIDKLQGHSSEAACLRTNYTENVAQKVA